MQSDHSQDTVVDMDACSCRSICRGAKVVDDVELAIWQWVRWLLFAAFSRNRHEVCPRYLSMRTVNKQKEPLLLCSTLVDRFNRNSMISI